MQYARYPAVRRGVEGQQAGRARGDEEKANDFRAGETETRRQRTRHENEVQGDCAFPVLHNHFIGAGHLGRPIAILLGLGSSVAAPTTVAGGGVDSPLPEVSFAFFVGFG